MDSDYADFCENLKNFLILMFCEIYIFSTKFSVPDLINTTKYNFPKTKILILMAPNLENV